MERLRSDDPSVNRWNTGRLAGFHQVQKVDSFMAVDLGIHHKDPLSGCLLIITGKVDLCVAFFHPSDGIVDCFKPTMRGLGNFRGYGVWKT